MGQESQEITPLAMRLAGHARHGISAMPCMRGWKHPLGPRAAVAVLLHAQEEAA